MSYELVSALRVRGLKVPFTGVGGSEVVCPARAGVEGCICGLQLSRNRLPCACGG